ncbi:serine protease inhibitor Cvsi-2-like [Dreissena polymorpha]|uniref:Uncharacterized protein n=1 Tax=Dreissena polymorpha TaxID=45954 RepID=A0A9D4RZJ8_DREPO|nr:serine protease inhibitor Cvsi-2-like [Dreissena polymorpha]KAH3884357.1 hypothetical protein DPMN_008335 [Dreissena polymorpha]
MNTLPVLIAVCAFAVAVFTEDCRYLLQCENIQCAAGHTVECYQHLCTCAPNNASSCITIADCPTCADHHPHCLDNKCRCGLHSGSNGN